MEEFSTLLRKLLNIAPRWVKLSVTTSVLVGSCLQMLTIHSLIFQNIILNFFDYHGLSQYEWIVLGLALTMPVAGIWHLARRLIYGPSQYESAEAYIAVMKLAVESASMTPVQKRIFWNSAVSRLANQFSIGATPPAPADLINEIQKEAC